MNIDIETKIFDIRIKFEVHLYYESHMCTNYASKYEYSLGVKCICAVV